MNIDGHIDPVSLDDGAGVPHGKVLIDFVDATATRGDELAVARDRVIEAMGHDALVDAAAVVANFTMMTRIADSTGTPLDPGSVEISTELRAGLDVDRYVSARLPE